MGKKSISSEWVIKEGKIALANNKILPIMLEPVQLPKEFSDVQTDRLTARDGAEQTQNVAKVIQVVEKKPGNTSSEFSNQYFANFVTTI